jgi:hypothetical protein
MKANAKKAVDFPSRAATLAAETDGASGSERAKVVLEKRPGSRLPHALEGSAALSYADIIGFFFVFVFFLAMMCRIGVHLHAVALLLGHGDCVWMDQSQIGLHRGIDSNARDIQCDSVLCLVDDRGGLNWSR